jgi:hypothetical protein
MNLNRSPFTPTDTFSLFSVVNPFNPANSARSQFYDSNPVVFKAHYRSPGYSWEVEFGPDRHTR